MRASDSAAVIHHHPLDLLLRVIGREEVEEAEIKKLAAVVRESHDADRRKLGV